MIPADFKCRLGLEMLILDSVPAVSFALGIPTISRGSYSYLKQTLTSVLSWMTRSEEVDSVVIVSVADVCMNGNRFSCPFPAHL